jgi:hypothetical protein
MKKGFAIEIQEGLNEKEMASAIWEANDFIGSWIKNNGSWKEKSQVGGWSSFLRRGTVGYPIRTRPIPTTIDGQQSGLYFRRASKSRRIFQIVRACDLNLKPNQTMKHGGVSEKIGSMCMCPGHEGALKVSTKYGEIKTKTYCMIGEIKG